ncbi:MAG: radical SAM protein, partial [Patescibacteria group bacterium]|nr:radical SAM protein [Patescibacteria group bacterium]
MVKFVEIEAKSILQKKKFRDDWFWNRYNLNPYRGCQFACNYCDAITEKYLVHKDYKDFSRIIYVKKNAPEVLEKEVKKVKPDVVAMSGVTDPYQPAERKYELTRKILEILAKHKFPVHIITKSDLVLRDIDLLRKIADETWCTVSLTIVTFNHELLPLLEPFAPSPEKRLNAIKKLNEEGIQAGVDFTPIVPYLLDKEKDIEEVIKRASEHTKYILIGASMTLRSNQRLRFLELLKKNFPEVVEKYEKLYGKQGSPPPNYIIRLNKCAFEFCKRYRINNYIQPPSFERSLKQKTLIPRDYDRNNFKVASLLLLIAFFKEFKSANPYSAWAYHKASQNIENLNESIKDICERGELRKIHGVGESIIKVIEDFLVNERSER